jgi:hypothetical protein
VIAKAARSILAYFKTLSVDPVPWIQQENTVLRSEPAVNTEFISRKNS